jgi:hypothetical protein
MIFEGLGELADEAPVDVEAGAKIPLATECLLRARGLIEKHALVDFQR